MAEGYVANWGNDNNGGTGWNDALKSIQAAIDAGLNPINLKGFFNESVISAYQNINANGAVMDGTNLAAGFGNLQIDGGKYRNWDVILDGRNYKNIYIAKITSNSLIRFNTVDKWLLNINAGLTIELRSINGIKGNNTFHFISVQSLTLSNYLTTSAWNKLYAINSIISNANLQIKESDTYFYYSLYINTAFKFTGGGLGTDETTYEYPTGLDNDERLQNLKDRMAIVYGGVSGDYLVGCRYYSGSYNDVFVDADNGNFYLKNDLNNPALGIGYNGEHAGARPVAAITTNIATANTLTNINNSTGAITDQNLDASAYWTTIQDAGTVREIASFDAIAEIAYRNGLSINPMEYMGADIIAGSNVLISSKQYQVRDDANTGGTIVLDDSGGTILSVWDTFTAVDEGSGAGLGFSSVDNLTVREIDITKFDERIRIKVSTDDATLATANEITMLLHDTPLVNVDASNIPAAGNGDAAYDPNTAVPLQARYMQVWVDIQSDQLFAR